ncbi:hypothetical protein PPTG_23306 [Phytophthora nicotianae INRA-310]|uniref:Uncharacterized protein n=1 Tax=Phytophthora nicotianae (strain INRA-310) TaxID=761204 RepID=W2Q2I5_PHYN3|nr:hypothetical protein PPTG_23306 [Phytophthora nicotianae INRA-310]ETN06495.1 hypothetical protein PPTG_23306 [Phytophthora nicotianae INRA-310]
MFASRCKANFWDRDVNAAINMLELLKSEVQGHGRMAPFKIVDISLM